MSNWSFLVLFLVACEMEMSDPDELRSLTAPNTCNPHEAAAEVFRDAPAEVSTSEAQELCELSERDYKCELEKNNTIERCCESYEGSSGPRRCCTLNKWGAVDCYIAKV